MFLEFTLYDDEKIIFNINHITAIHSEEGKTLINCGMNAYVIKENYNEVIEAINNYYNLSKA